MTGRVVEPTTESCCAAGCKLLGEYHADIQAWAKVDPEHKLAPFRLQTNLVVCQGHKDTPPSAAAEFFTPGNREFCTGILANMGKAEPDYDGAEWVFTPLQLQPAPKAAN